MATLTKYQRQMLLWAHRNARGLYSVATGRGIGPGGGLINYGGAFLRSANKLVEAGLFEPVETSKSGESQHGNVVKRAEHTFRITEAGRSAAEADIRDC